MLAMALMLLCSMNVVASEDDNSLSSLGILTEGATVSPEFAYNTWSYTVTVPGGTKELSLDPTPSSASATISSISGTTLNEDGTGYVTVTVQAGNGDQFTYELNVVSDGTAPAVQETETETEKQTETEKETEPETEDSRYVKVDKNSLQEAENTITNLKGEITNYKDKVSLFTKIMYGLIGLSVILLFVVINLLLKKKDLKSELNDYRSYGYTESKKQPKASGKAEKKAEKKQKKQKADRNVFEESYQEPMQNTYPSRETQSGVKPASMSGYAPAQNDYQQPSGQMYSGLDVQPQKSQNKAKKMPQYEQPMQPSYQQPAPSQAPMPKQGRAAEGKGKKGKKNDVEINMIDL